MPPRLQGREGSASSSAKRKVGQFPCMPWHAPACSVCQSDKRMPGKGRPNTHPQVCIRGSCACLRFLLLLLRAGSFEGCGSVNQPSLSREADSGERGEDVLRLCMRMVGGDAALGWVPEIQLRLPPPLLTAVRQTDMDAGLAGVQACRQASRLAGWQAGRNRHAQNNPACRKAPDHTLLAFCRLCCGCAARLLPSACTSLLPSESVGGAYSPLYALSAGAPCPRAPA